MVELWAAEMLHPGETVQSTSVFAPVGSNWNVLCTVKLVEKEPSGCTGTDPAVATSHVPAGWDAHSMIDTSPLLAVGSDPVPVPVSLRRSVNPVDEPSVIAGPVAAATRSSRALAATMLVAARARKNRLAW